MISDKAVEAAARAACAGLWDRLTPAAQEATLINMRAALQAALPVLLEGKAEEIARVIDRGAFEEERAEKRSYRRKVAREAADRIIAMLTDGKG